MEIEKVLKEFGLKEKEIKVYIELLPLGSVNLQEIARRVNLPRTTIYNTLNFLTQKGLVSRIIRKNVTFFEASEPRRLINILNEKKELLEEILPGLDNLMKNKKATSKIEIYEGTKGLFSMLSEVYEEGNELYMFGSYTMSVTALKHQPEYFRKIRIRRKIQAKFILDSDDPDFHKKGVKKFTEVRVLDSLKDFPCLIFIFADCVSINVLKGDLVGVLIKNKEISQSMKIIFDMYWKISKKVKM